MNFINKIKNLKLILREIRYFKNLIKKYGIILKKGKYRLFPSRRAVVLENKYSIEKATPYFSKNIKKYKLLIFIELLNKLGYFRNANRNSYEEYEAIYSANNFDKVRELKFFSFERKEILTICTSRDKFLKQLSEYEQLNGCFNMPKLINNEKYDNSFIISMVNLLPRPDEQETLKEIICCTTKFNNEKKITNKKKNISDIMTFNYNEDINAILLELSNFISKENSSLEIETCMTHGDLSRDNLIYGNSCDKEGFWWIDWEHKGERVFFYDFFFYILNMAFCYSDKTALNLYLIGQCDECLSNFFMQFGLCYDIKYRRDYFIIYTIEFLKERVCETNNIIALKEYFDFIKEIIF